MMRSTTIVVALCGATDCTGDIEWEGTATGGDRLGEGEGGGGGPRQPGMAPDLCSAGRWPDPGRSPVRRLTRFEYTTPSGICLLRVLNRKNSPVAEKKIGPGLSRFFRKSPPYVWRAPL